MYLLFKNLIDKKYQYEKAGVEEYWVVSKDKVYKYLLVNDVYLEKIYLINKDLKLKVDKLETCIIDFQPIVDRYL